jgi:hypothetical protein
MMNHRFLLIFNLNQFIGNLFKNLENFHQIFVSKDLPLKILPMNHQVK